MNERILIVEDEAITALGFRYLVKPVGRQE